MALFLGSLRWAPTSDLYLVNLIKVGHAFPNVWEPDHTHWDAFEEQCFWEQCLRIAGVMKTALPPHMKHGVSFPFRRV